MPATSLSALTASTSTRGRARARMVLQALGLPASGKVQIEPGDLPAIKAAGYVTVIDNRPDGEIPPNLHSSEMRRAAEALGLAFVANPVIGGQITMDNVTAQGAAIAAQLPTRSAYVRADLARAGEAAGLVGAAAQALAPIDILVNNAGIQRPQGLLEMSGAPGSESLDVRLFSEADIPWDELAFRSVSLTLRTYFEERRKGRFGVHHFSLGYRHHRDITSAS